MTARRVVLVRHGATDWNLRQVFQGHTDIPLNDLGRSQAADMAPEVARTLQPTRIVCSDLARARDTALVLAASCGCEIAPDSRLREINVGKWEGLSMADIIEEAPTLQGDLDADENFRWSATGETLKEATTRVVAAIREYADQVSPEEVLAVVSHGAVIRNSVIRLMGFDGQLGVMGVIANCGWAVMKPQSSYWQLIAYNRTAKN